MKKRFRTLEISNPDFQPEHLRYVTVKSNHLKGRGDCTFFIPPQIKRINKNIPVVILLHGVYGSHWAWTYNINVHNIALRLIAAGKIKPVILVMPSDGLMGDGSGYFNHGEHNFEKWIVKDVVDLIKEVIPHSQGSLRLFISGLSMGGYGALRLMGKYPALFSGASGLSSITCLKDLLPFLTKEEQVYYKKKFKAENVFAYLKKNRKKLPPFRFDCGRDDNLYHSNVILHQQLDKEGIQHVFEEFSGGHNNEYWNQNIGRTLIYFNELANSQ
ncbi:MAG: acetyl esterase [Marivirga sp.]|nr:acetyl esterase [Marivirga sp.]